MKSLEEINAKITTHMRVLSAANKYNVVERNKQRAAIEALRWVIEEPKITSSQEGFDHLFTKEQGGIQ